MSWNNVPISLRRRLEPRHRLRASQAGHCAIAFGGLVARHHGSTSGQPDPQLLWLYVESFIKP
jgi:hypothetical protein